MVSTTPLVQPRRNEVGNFLESRATDSAVKTPRPAVLTELVLFLVVGGLAALCFAWLSATMIEQRTGLPDWVVSALCYAAFIGPVYLAHRLLAFRSDVPHAVALPRYIAVQLSALTLASIFSYVCYSVIGLPTVAAAAVVIGLTSAVNFVVLRLWAFAVRR
jgi:putative flippase GtrA